MKNKFVWTYNKTRKFYELQIDGVIFRIWKIALKPNYRLCQYLPDDDLLADVPYIWEFNKLQSAKTVAQLFIEG